jgi:hypothetical protein
VLNSGKLVKILLAVAAVKILVLGTLLLTTIRKLHEADAKAREAQKVQIAVEVAWWKQGCEDSLLPLSEALKEREPTLSLQILAYREECKESADQAYQQKMAEAGGKPKAVTSQGEPKKEVNAEDMAAAEGDGEKAAAVQTPGSNKEH